MHFFRFWLLFFYHTLLLCLSRSLSFIGLSFTDPSAFVCMSTHMHLYAHGIYIYIYSCICICRNFLSIFHPSACVKRATVTATATAAVAVLTKTFLIDWILSRVGFLFSEKCWDPHSGKIHLILVAMRIIALSKYVH